MSIKYLILPVGCQGLNLIFFFFALRCWHMFPCYLLEHKDALSAVASFRMSCWWFCFRGEAVTVSASSLCDSDSTVWWIKPECHLGLSSLEAVCSSARTHTHTPTVHSLSDIHDQSIYLVMHTLV